MPELPDVENFRRYLDAHALDRKIRDADVLAAKVLRGVSRQTLRKALTGHRLRSSCRHGKHLLARIDDGPWLALHFGMTGYLKSFERSEDDPEHDRFRLDFEDGGHVAFVCQRMLGEIALTKDADTFVTERGLGPDALDDGLTEKAFTEALAGKRGQLKSALMDQKFLSGIGNVYSDEILFQGRLHPRKDVGDLTERQRGALYRTMRKVLKTAIDRGAGSEELFDRLPRSYLLPHRGKEGKCPRCHGPIRTLKAGGRNAYYCPTCQPA